jgi:hypothetical protein
MGVGRRIHIVNRNFVDCPERRGPAFRYAKRFWGLSVQRSKADHEKKKPPGVEMGMDTDYLTPMAYDCIWLAEEAIDVLKTELGAACNLYPDENVYLRGILTFVKEIEEDPEGYLRWWNLFEQTDIAVFRERIRMLREHIEKTIKTPIAERGEPEFRS